VVYLRAAMPEPARFSAAAAPQARRLAAQGASAQQAAALPPGEPEVPGVSGAAAEQPLAAVAQDAAEVLRPEEVAWGAAEAPRPAAVWAGAEQRQVAAPDAAEVPQQEEAVRAAAEVPRQEEAVRVAAVVRQQEAARDAAVRLPAAPDARAAPPWAAPWVFRQGRFLAPARGQAVRLARAMENLRTASRSAR
jgi:pilus assembly protein FimV